MSEQDNLLYFNGIDGSSGTYEVPPMSSEQLSNFIQGQAAPENLEELKWQHSNSTMVHAGVKEGVDALNLGEAGWGIIFTHDANPAIKEALAPLLQWRQAVGSWASSGKTWGLMPKRRGVARPLFLPKGHTNLGGR